jgi:hypothetical protein
MSLRGLFATALVTVVIAGGCARERGEDAQSPRRPQRLRPQGQTQPHGQGQTTYPTSTAPAPTATTAPTATATSTQTSAPPAGTTPPPISPTELIKFQDACWKNCDQFACMKIAEAYRTGSGLPQDVLAGRRYAVHACQECGTPSVAVEGHCPTWGFDKK